MTDLTRARLQVLGAAVLFSTGGAAIKACTLTGWQVACFRSAMAAVAVLAGVRAARQGMGRRAWIVGVAYAATLTFFVLSTKLTTAANAIFLQSTAPLYLVLLGPLLLGEPVRRRDIPFVVVIAAGLSLFFVGGASPLATAPDPARGNLIAVLSGVAWAFTVAGLRWLGRGDAAGASTAQGAVAAGNLVAFAACLPMALPVTGASVADVGVLAYLGIVQIGVAYVLLSAGLRHVAALDASLLLLLEPVLNPAWARLVNGESPSPWSVAGGAAILGAIAARTWLDRPAATSAPAA